jgi:hypothetical protein
MRYVNKASREFQSFSFFFLLRVAIAWLLGASLFLLRVLIAGLSGAADTIFDLHQFYQHCWPGSF